jgi:cytochrome b
LRFGHWALVIAFAVAYVTGDEEGEVGELHEWAGYIVGGIVTLRVIRGASALDTHGSAIFVKGPVSSSRYLLDLSI